MSIMIVIKKIANYFWEKKTNVVIQDFKKWQNWL